MITVRVSTDFAAVRARLAGLQREQIPFATSLALNRTAEAVQAELRAELGRLLDKPKPYTTRGTFIARSNKRQLVATIGLIDRPSRGNRGPAQYLAAELAGGPRKATAWERALRKAGALPDGWRAVPGEAARLDPYGNLHPRLLAEIFGTLRTGIRIAAGRGKRASLQTYFVARPGDRATAHLAPGIYRRIEKAGQGSSIRPVVRFVGRTTYRRLFDLERIARRVVPREFPRQFEAAAAQAMATAR